MALTCPVEDHKASLHRTHVGYQPCHPPFQPPCKMNKYQPHCSIVQFQTQGFNQVYTLTLSLIVTYSKYFTMSSLFMSVPSMTIAWSTWGASLILLAINSVLSRGSSQGQVGVKLVLSQGQVGVTLGSFLGQYWSN